MREATISAAHHCELACCQPEMTHGGSDELRTAQLCAALLPHSINEISMCFCYFARLHTLSVTCSAAGCTASMSKGGSGFKIRSGGLQMGFCVQATSDTQQTYHVSVAQEASPQLLV
jgi:hypothetical protein